MKASIIIPSLNPDEKLLEVVKGLSDAGAGRIILVDDGSRLENRRFFQEALGLHPDCVLLRHDENKGKGRALKTAFRYFLQHQDKEIGVVTVDGDNQHRPEDVMACVRALQDNPESLVLGCRQFTGPQVPARSAFGNRLTAGCFRLLCGLAISDTQTGLRGISADFLRTLLEVKGERFEFETNMLLESKQQGIPIIEVPIHTVYLEENASSHFHPLRDSFAIYKQILKFLWSGVASLLLDYGLFLLLCGLLHNIDPAVQLLAATFTARLCSSIFNYIVNRRLVFGSKNPLGKTLLKYYALCVVQAIASYAGVYLLDLLRIWPAVAKLAVDGILFLLSFQIQREWIFHTQKRKGRSTNGR